MSIFELPAEGSAKPDVRQLADHVWREAAEARKIALVDFGARDDLSGRIAWARGLGLGIGCVLSRYSHDDSHSTEAQIRDNLTCAARNGIYVPPEFLCVDEAITGRKSKRAGLIRMKLIFERRLAETLVLFKLSRLLRTNYKAFQFLQEDIVDKGMRAIVCAQNIDTADEKNWKQLAYLYGMMDEALIGTIGDHVRSGLKSMFADGYVVGALTVGYDPVVTDGRLTNRGLPRRVPKVNERFRELYLKHVDLHLQGMTIAEGWQRWVNAGGPYDPRATLGYMSREAYRRMLANPRYTGLWAFCRKKNVWRSKSESPRQVEQDEGEVVTRSCDDLRMIDDQTFTRLQTWLAGRDSGGGRPAGSKRRWGLADHLTKFFICSACGTRYYQGSGLKPTMRCKRGKLCPCPAAVRRDQAVAALCRELRSLVLADAELVDDVVDTARKMAADSSAIQAEIAAKEQRRRTLTSNIEFLLGIGGDGTEADRQETKSRIAKARLERQQLDAADVRAKLAEFSQLLDDGAAGRLGQDDAFRAVRVVELLTDGKILVDVERRPGRVTTHVRGRFTPQIVNAVLAEAGLRSQSGQSGPVTIWLREPPQCDRLAVRVHELVDVERLSFAEATSRLRAEGHSLHDTAAERI